MNSITNKCEDKTVQYSIVFMIKFGPESKIKFNNLSSETFSVNNFKTSLAELQTQYKNHTEHMYKTSTHTIKIDSDSLFVFYLYMYIDCK